MFTLDELLDLTYDTDGFWYIQFHRNDTDGRWQIYVHHKDHAYTNVPDPPTSGN
jgi:hypothetical protein